MKYGFIIDNRRCIGCHACTVACKSEHGVPLGVNRTWVKYVEKGVFPQTRRVFAVHRCNHCTDAPCVEICPVTSLFIRADGIVDFDPQRCIGCKSCMQACPYDALYIDPNTHTSAKCNYCAHRIDLGLEPACVIVCPVHAIVSGDMEDPGSEIAHLLARQQVTARKPEKGTRPNLFYINGDQAALTPTAAPPELNYFAGAQASGVGHFAARAAETPPVTAAGAQARVFSQAGQPPPPLHEGMPEAAAGARRSYDAPVKGVLWGWEVSGYLWSKSMAAGVVLLPLLLEMMGALALPPRLAQGLVAASLALLALTGVLLVKDLDRPARFLYVLLRPQWRSWLVRGAYIITAFGAAGSLWGWHLFNGGGFLPPPALAALKTALVLLAVLAATYTAFLFAQAKGRDFWQSPLLPPHMLVNALMAGGATALLLAHPAAGLGGGAAVAPLKVALEVALWAHLALLAVELGVTHVTADTAQAIAEITRGALRLPFWSAVVLGNLGPLALLRFVPGGAALPAACALVILFSLVIEHVWVRAPQLVPLR